MTTSFGNIRSLPGLYGGGFARVLDVQSLTGGRVSGTDGPLGALVRMEKLQDPLKTFSQNLQQFSGDPNIKPSPVARLSSDVLTLLQQINPSQGPAVGEAPSFAEALDTQLAQREQARAEQEKQQQRAQEQQQNSGVVEASEFAQELGRPEDPLGQLGPDLLKQLDALLNKKVELDIPTLPLAANELAVETAVGTSPALAALAAQSYASNLSGARA
jgi:hypothetical protein